MKGRKLVSYSSRCCGSSCARSSGEEVLRTGWGRTKVLRKLSLGRKKQRPALAGISGTMGVEHVMV